MARRTKHAARRTAGAHIIRFWTISYRLCSANAARSSERRSVTTEVFASNQVAGALPGRAAERELCELYEEPPLDSTKRGYDTIVRWVSSAVGVEIVTRHPLQASSEGCPECTNRASGQRSRDRPSDSGRYLDACLRDKVKLQRAHGGCLGDERR